MRLCALLIVFVAVMGCQSGRIPCPEIKIAKIKESKVNKTRFVAAPSRMMASTKPVPEQRNHPEVDLERMRATRTTGQQMLDKYGTVEEWDCPSPSGKRKQSKVAKENVRKNEKKMREHLKQRSESDSLNIVAPLDLR
jgi:hypothetical protein